MFSRIFQISVLIAAVAIIAVASGPDVSFAQSQTKSSKKSSKAKITVPPGGCLISDATAAIENSKTCAAGCKNDWCTVSWCVNGQLSGSWVGCYEPSKLCVPKC